MTTLLLFLVPEIRKYCASNGLPFKVLLILDNAPGHPRTPRVQLYEQITKWWYWPQTQHLYFQPLDHGVIRTFKGSLHTVLYRKNCWCCGRQCLEWEQYESLEDYTTEDAISCRKSHESHQAWNNKFLLKKTVPDVMHDFREFTIEPIKEIRK